MFSNGRLWTEMCVCSVSAGDMPVRDPTGGAMAVLPRPGEHVHHDGRAVPGRDHGSAALRHIRALRFGCRVPHYFDCWSSFGKALLAYD